MLGCLVWAWRNLSVGEVCGYRDRRRSEREVALPPWSPMLLCAGSTWNDMVEVEEGEGG